MNDAPRTGGSGNRVRPGLRRVAIVAFAILLPIVAHSLWDYIELRRLVREIEGIRTKGEPVTAREAPGGDQPLVTAEREAASYYLAGAMLALGTAPYRVVAPVRGWFAEPSPNRQSLPELTKPLHQLVQQSSDALMLADKAASLPFTIFPAGTEYSYRTAGVLELSELITARTLTLSESGDGDAAADSALSGLQIRRALHDVRWASVSGPQVAAVLSLSQPSADALRRLQMALDAEDKPNPQLESLLEGRASFVEIIWRRYYGTDPKAPRHYSLPMRSITETIMRPWITHETVEALRLWAELLEITKTPWPARAQQGAAVLEKYRTAQNSQRKRYLEPFFGQELAIAMFRQAVDPTDLIIDRCSRVAIAAERFQRERGDLPLALSDLVPRYIAGIPADPLSGRPLLFRRGAESYTIYSVGQNQKDDGGDLTSEFQRTVERKWGPRLIRGTDVGIRVLTQRNKNVKTIVRKREV